MSAGYSHSCAVRDTGAVVCWGTAHFGNTEAPQGVFVSVAVGLFHSCAVGESGEIACWGAEGFAQGGGDPDAAPALLVMGLDASSPILPGYAYFDSPVRVDRGQTNAPPGRYRSVSAGNFHTCAVRESGEVDCWGKLSLGGGDVVPPAGTSYRSASAGSTDAAFVSRVKSHVGATIAPHPPRGATCP